MVNTSSEIKYTEYHEQIDTQIFPHIYPHAIVYDNTLASRLLGVVHTPKSKWKPTPKKTSTIKYDECDELLAHVRELRRLGYADTRVTQLSNGDYHREYIREYIGIQRGTLINRVEYSIPPYFRGSTLS